MLIELAADSLGQEPIPAEWGQMLCSAPDGITATGDRTGLVDLYLHANERQAVFATDPGELLDWMHAHDHPVLIDRFGLSSMLHHAHIPAPFTIFENVRFLPMGYRAVVVREGGELSTHIAGSYPYLNNLSREDQEPDPARLLELVTAATARQVADGGNSGFLMLSSGKDSVSVALALAEAGLRHIPCVTYRAGPDDPEPAMAAAVCRKLGLDHDVVDMPPPGAGLRESLTRFFRTSPLPSGHATQIPYVTVLATAATGPGVILDGGGNDTYMGFLPSRAQSLKQTFRIRGRGLARIASTVLRPDSPINYLARSRAEATLPSRTLRLRETRRLYRDAVDTRQWWYDLSRETRHLDLVDLGGVTVSLHVGTTAAAQKMRLAARTVGMGVSMPFCDAPTVDYYFNLPEASRFNRETGENKSLLREMLLRYLDYDAAAIGKHYFTFDAGRFILENKSYVRDEIAGCELWDAAGAIVADSLLNRLEKRPRMDHSIAVLFLVSGWYNHSKYTAPARASSQ